MTYIKLKKGRLKVLLSQAIKLSGNLRKLEKEIGIPRTTLSDHHNEKFIAIREDRLNKIINYLKIKMNEEDIIEILPSNWRQVKGGKKLVEMRRKNGTLEESLKKIRKNGSIYLKKWHKKMKKENPEKYHLMQYEKFKKIGGYKFLTENNERVRNKLEQEVANLLRKMKFNYKYEPLIKVNNKFFFPDFLIDNNIIIECTEWRGLDKAIKLKHKINSLKKEYKVYVVIPKTLKRYYETLNHHLLLGIDELIKELNRSG